VYGVDETRDALEIELVHLAVQTGWPLLAICRGIQVLNVALSGTLFTHIADQIERPLLSTIMGAAIHAITWLTPFKITDGACSNAFSAKEIAVNSMHHQGIEHLRPACSRPRFRPMG
jgi:putative glutamine amidotransferase